MILVDSHCHLDLDHFTDDREAAIERALAAGVKFMVAIGMARGEEPERLDKALALARAHPHCMAATAGVHPHDAASADAGALERVRELARADALARAKGGARVIIAVGECGLDYFYKYAPHDVQAAVFRAQIDLAIETDLPVVVHSRDAASDTAALLEEGTLRNLKGVMHCFTYGPAEAERFLALGLTLSIPGVVTYKKAPEVREAVRLTPLDRLLVETDAPYLSPEPFRGKRNEPAYVVKTAQIVAELKGVTLEELAAATSANFSRLFGIKVSA